MKEIEINKKRYGRKRKENIEIRKLEKKNQ